MWHQNSSIWRAKQKNLNLLRNGNYCFVLQIELHSDVLQGVYLFIIQVEVSNRPLQLGCLLCPFQTTSHFFGYRILCLFTSKQRNDTQGNDMICNGQNIMPKVKRSILLPSQFWLQGFPLHKGWFWRLRPPPSQSFSDLVIFNHIKCIDDM